MEYGNHYLDPVDDWSTEDVSHNVPQSVGQSAPPFSYTWKDHCKDFLAVLFIFLVMYLWMFL